MTDTDALTAYLRQLERIKDEPHQIMRTALKAPM